MSASENRLSTAQLYKLQPQLLASLLELSKAATKGLDARLVHLVRLRVSQLNGCAYCLQMHAAEARKDNEQQNRLDVLSAWRETTLFSPQEQAALSWAESLTLIAAQHGISDMVYQQASELFSTAELANLTALVIEINSWNRIAVSFYASVGNQ